MADAEVFAMQLRKLEILNEELLALQCRCSHMVKEASMSGRAAAEVVRNLAVRCSTLEMVIEQLEAFRPATSPAIAADQADAGEQPK